MQGRPKVLFLSRGNTARGQMAEGFLRSLAGERFIAASAGVDPGTLHPIAIEVMDEVGVDISRKEPKDVTHFWKEHFAYVVTLFDSARERSPVYPFSTNLRYWNLLDPAAVTGSLEERKAAFRRVRDQIRINVLSFVAEIEAAATRPLSLAHARG